MTFLEEAKTINPTIDEETILAMYCPCSFDLEEDKNCAAVDRKKCVDCWNREIPNMEKKMDRIPVISQSENDLISRQSVIDIIHKEIEKASSFAEHETQINIEMAVSELPTAYDVEKVAKEVTNFTKNKKCDDISMKICNIMKSCESCKAIHVGNIVRNGGKE